MIKSTYVTEGHYNGNRSWIKSVLDEGCVCLPVAYVLVSGTFGKVRTETAVSDKLSLISTFICFQTKKILREEGKCLGELK